MAPSTNKSSRTNSHQPGWLVCTFCGLWDRMADQLLLGALSMWPLKFQGFSCLQGSWTTTAPDLLCGFVQTTSSLWASIILETPQLLRISYLISPWAILLSLSAKRDEVGLGRGEWRLSFCVGAVWAAVGVPLSFFYLSFLFFLNRKVILNLKWGAAKSHTPQISRATTSCGERAEFLILTVLSPGPPKRGATHSIHPLLGRVTKLKNTCLLAFCSR